MARNVVGAVLRGYRTLDGLGITGDRTDEELLNEFRFGSGDARELSFATLIERHGPMVHRVCWQVLKDYHDAQDAAQATFLALAIHARTIRRPGSLGSWLHGVALRISAHARSEAARRREIEQSAGQEIAVGETPADLAETARVLHHEVDRLPAHYRAAIIACDLEGLSHDEAAQRLRVPVRTLQTRLYRGRERLRSRLVRGGIYPAAADLAGIPSEPTHAAVSTRWIDATAQAAARITEGSRALSTNLVSHRVLTWARGLCHGRTIRHAAFALSAAGLIFGGSLMLANQDGRGPQPARVLPPPPAKTPAASTQPASRPEVGSPIARPLPAAPELQRILREAAGEAMRLAKEKPQPGSWMLAKIAQVQARAGDRAGATTTFAAAVEEAGGGANPPDAQGLRWIGQAQIAAGMSEEARATFLKAALAVPRKVGDPSKDRSNFSTSGRSSGPRYESAIASTPGKT